jgi:hypothetical protein
MQANEKRELSVMISSSPVLSSMAASVDRESHRKAEMQRRSRLVAPHEERRTDTHCRLLDGSEIQRSIKVMSFMVKVRCRLRAAQWYRARREAVQQAGM